MAQMFRPPQTPGQQLAEMPFQAARGLIDKLDRALLDPKAQEVVLDRGDAILSLGLLEALIGVLTVRNPFTEDAEHQLFGMGNGHHHAGDRNSKA